jgi:hypothetical protein
MSTLSEALFKHQRGFRERIRPAFYCTGCDWTAVVVADGCDGNGVTIDDQHRTHLADILESIVAARVEAALAPVRAALPTPEQFDRKRARIRATYTAASESGYMLEEPSILEAQNITSGCRAGRGEGGAWDEAVRRLREIYDAQVQHDPSVTLSLAIFRGDFREGVG